MATDNKNKVLNVPHLRFPEFSGEWEKYRLCDVASIVGRIGFRGYTTNDIVTKGKGAIALSPTNIENNKLTYDKDNTYISFYKYEESPEIMIKQGDVIFVKTGSTVGKVAYVDKLICKTTLNPQVVVLKDIQCDNYLLSVLMSTNKFQNAIRKIIVGGAVPTLSQAAMGDIVVTMPQATEQEKLSKFISLLDDRIATQNKIIEKLQSLIKGIVDNLMTALLKGELYPFSSFYIKAGEGGTPTTSVDEYYSEGTIPFIKIDDLSCKYLTSNKEFITELGMQKSSAWLIPSQSVIYSNGATIGAISINEYPVCTKQGILGIVPNTNVNVEYLFLLMSSSFFSKEVNRIITEGTMKTAYLKDINHIKCPLPSMAQQKSITNLTSSIEEKLYTEKKLLKFLNLQKQHLLRTMFI